MLLTVERFGSQLRSPASRLRQIVDHSNELDDSASDVTKSRRECRTSEPNEIRVSIVSDYRTLTLKTLNNIFRVWVANCDMSPSIAGITGRN